MGAMKNIAIDAMDLQEAAFRAETEEDFLTHVTQAGWLSPTEQAGRSHQASKMVGELDDAQRIAFSRILDTLGLRVSTVESTNN